MTGPPLKWNRRRFLRTAGLTALGMVSAGVYVREIEPHWIEIVRRTMPITGAPAVHGWRLAHLSDLHVGPSVDPHYQQSVLRRVAALEPELVVFTGDFITQFGTRVDGLSRLPRILDHFPRGRFGTFAVLGNHDYGAAWSHAEVADQVAARARDAGIQVLRNETHGVHGLTIIGIDDLWAKRSRPEVAMHRISLDTPAIALAHNPDLCDLPVWSGFRGWILSGHTHGGQVRLPFLPPLLLPVRNRRYVSGAIDLHDGRWLYVSRGIGHLLRARFCVRPEVTVFTLVPA
jgi:predicted MPP superfamily phosphohydrolase